MTLASCMNIEVSAFVTIFFIRIECFVQFFVQANMGHMCEKFL